MCQPCPGHAICRLIVAVVADCRVEPLANRIPDDRSCSSAAKVSSRRLRSLHNLAAVHNGGHLPGNAGVSRIIETHNTVSKIWSIDESALRGLRNGSDHSTRRSVAPRKAGKAKSAEGVIPCNSVL